MEGKSAVTAAKRVSRSLRRTTGAVRGAAPSERAPAIDLVPGMGDHALHDGPPDGAARVFGNDEAGGERPTPGQCQRRHGEHVDRVTDEGDGPVAPRPSAITPAPARRAYPTNSPKPDTMLVMAAVAPRCARNGSVTLRAPSYLQIREEVRQPDQEQETEGARPVIHHPDRVQVRTDAPGGPQGSLPTLGGQARSRE